MMDHGKIFVIEGLDGSGKNTQAGILVDKLVHMGKQARMISMPNYESISSGPVKLYLDRQISSDPQKVNPYASCSFFAVDRFIHFTCNWKKFYENKDSLLICDRYSTSNMIYQLAKIKPNEWDEFLEWIYEYEYKRMEIPKPDLVIYLKVPIHVSQRLMQIRLKSDLHESNLNFLKLCESAAIYSSKKFGWNIIKCSSDGKNIDSIDSISNKIMEIIKDKI